MKEDARFSDSNKNDICIGKNYNKHTQTYKHTYIHKDNISSDI